MTAINVIDCDACGIREPGNRPPVGGWKEVSVDIATPGCDPVHITIAHICPTCRMQGESSCPTDHMTRLGRVVLLAISKLEK
jgi:hypothetical protein